MIKKLYLLFLFLLPLGLYSQELTQVIRGQVIDHNSELPIIGANVVLLNSDPLKGTTTDLNGAFRLTEIPVGNQSIIVSFLGYESAVLKNLVLNSKKEVVLTIKLKEKAFEGKEVVISATQDKKRSQNKMATVSARTFSMDEAKRYAGSLTDVSRMAQNFAGVQSADDTRNDLVIRGNSSIGVLYRLEGVDIPNPNHFAFFGSTGGPVSLLNNNLLSNSDFFTGAFPAEYGNAASGVFDLKMRNGNNEQHEFMGQFGLNGFEAMAEGPLKKRKASYLVNLRYNDLDFYKTLGVNLGTQAVPTYFDGTFKLHFKHKNGNTKLFGLAGNSFIEFLESERGENETFFNENASDLYYSTAMAATGLVHTRLVKDGYFRWTLSYNFSRNGVAVDTLDPVTNAPFNTYNNRSAQGKYSSFFVYNRKLNRRSLLKTGLMADLLFYDLNEKFYANRFNTYLFRQKFEGTTSLLQPFVQWKFDVTEKVSLNAGVHSLLFLYNNSATFEPRLGLNNQITDVDLISIGYGVHGQVPPSSLYFKQVNNDNGTFPNPNNNLKPYYSQHLVLAYDRFFTEKVRLKAEIYAQKLDNVPVSFQPSTYSLLNQGANFGFGFPDTLTNQGEGFNYGLELTLEQFLNKGFYYLFTASFFEALYKPSDNNWYSTAFSSNYALNLLSGKEFKIGGNKENQTQNYIGIDGRIVFNGGQRYTPLLEDESVRQQEFVFDQSKTFELRYQDYFRFDLKLSWKFYGPKVSQEFALDVQNITSRKNIFNEEFDLQTGTYITRYQLGRLPVVFYRVFF